MTFGFKRSATSLLLAASLAAAPASAQDGALTGLLLRGGEAPAPRVGVGAPMYSPEQTASYLCVALAEGKGVEEARAAHAATVKARDVRINALNGGASPAEMARAERARQGAVLKMLGDDVLDAGFRSLGALFSRGREAPSQAWEGVVVEQVRAERVLENGRAVLNVSGQARNTSQSAVELPPLFVYGRDAAGFMVGGQSHLLDKTVLEPGETYGFTLRFKNPPAYAAKVEARFSDRFEKRNFRGCDFFDPATFNPRDPNLVAARAARLAPVPKVGDGAPDYTPAELAAIFPRLMLDAQVEFRAVRELRCPALPPPHRHSWRALFRQADLAYEAWVATSASYEVRRDAAEAPVPPGELEQAELGRQGAVNAFVAARPAPLPVEGDPAPFRLEALGLTPPTITGIIHNDGGKPATPHGLLISVRDRFGHVVTEVVREPEGVIAPGQGAPFSIPLLVQPAVAKTVQVAFRLDAPPPPPRKGQKDPCR